MDELGMSRRFRAAVAAAAVTLASTSGMVAAQTTPTFSFDLPAGVACPDFALRIEGFGERSVFREFKDRDGNAVRIFSGGKGYSLRFTNLDTGSVLEVRPNGSNDTTTFNADGTWRFITTGHYVMTYFPTDVAPGQTLPFTRQYIGRVEHLIDPSTFVGTLVKASGRYNDICAVLG